MVTRYQTYLVIAVLFGCFCTQAVAVQFTPDHQWTFKLGERSYGIAGYGARYGGVSVIAFAGHYRSPSTHLCPSS
jgi:hypothetical protein